MKLKKINLKPSGFLKPFKIPDGLVLVQDTREQLPLFDRPPKGLTVTTSTLKHGDYSIKGFEHKFVIERKQISDFYSYIGKERSKTISKMYQFHEIIKYGGYVGLVVEASEADILAGYAMSKVSPEAARQALVVFEIRYGVHVYYSRSRKDIGRWVLDRAIKFYQAQRKVQE